VQLLLENIPERNWGTTGALVGFLQYTRLDVKICFGHRPRAYGPRPAPGVETLARATSLPLTSMTITATRYHLMPFDGDIDWTEAVRDLRRGEGQFPTLFEIRDSGPEKSAASCAWPRVIERHWKGIPEEE